ncbi:related to tetracycline resistance protein (probable transport protein) [Fusarium torulosum]|uniref:Related to tetracycline resistance protein (Probable transport protein) n=1 Tax=Fusarium torulosum TaxID=33205 RepID=A0AAE8M2F2_9HYPO|nr:related to tetracycline resistance protein (probable transport protein) [Fusarium torulosum]
MTKASSRSPSPGAHNGSNASATTPLLVGKLIGTASSEAGPGAVSVSGEYGAIGASGDGTAEAIVAAPDPKPASKPMPKFQILLLCYARVMEPIAFFSIFPFIAQMVQENGHLPKTDVGFYSGLIESLFSATQMLVLLGWSQLADRIGRKPVLIITLIGTAIGPILFGMSKTIGQMILFRCLAGVFSGSGLVIRTMISELSTPETQAKAFSWFAFGGNVGIFLGPLIGGALADPAYQFPRAFGNVQFFIDYPYALQGFVVGAFSFTGCITSILFLKETLNQPKHTRRQVVEQPSRSMWELMKSPGVGISLWAYGHAMFLAFAFTAILPVALYTPVRFGGTGFDSFKISIYMAAQGASQAIWLLVAFPLLHRRIGTRGVMKICGYAYPWFFFGFIMLNLLLRAHTHAAMVTFWILGAVVTIVGPGVSMAFTGVQLAINDAAPDPHVVGTLNALAMSFASAVRAIVPGAATAIYAIGVRGQILYGHLAWVILIPLAMAFTVACLYIPEGKRSSKDNDEENEDES